MTDIYIFTYEGLNLQLQNHVSYSISITTENMKWTITVDVALWKASVKLAFRHLHINHLTYQGGKILWDDVEMRWCSQWEVCDFPLRWIKVLLASVYWTEENLVSFLNYRISMQDIHTEKEASRAIEDYSIILEASLFEVVSV